MKNIRDFDLEGKRVLMRCDFNVPLDFSGAIIDDFRIRQTVPTIQYAVSRGAKVILISHLGEPGGRVVKKLRMDVIRKRLEALLGFSVAKTQDCVGEEVEKQAARMTSGSVLLLENVRFSKEEEENDPEFAHKLSSLGDIFINDAFGASHRKHASIVGISKYLHSGVGFLLEKEMQALDRVMEGAKKPLVVIAGGSKVETKLGFLENISKSADWILLGNLLSQDIREQNIILKYPEKFILAIDGIISEGKELDIGPSSLALFKEKIREAGTIFWAGPLGRVEEEQYAKGSIEAAKAIIGSGAYCVAGGGDLSAFLGKHGLREKFSYVSTGGGAMLAYLAGEKLPGIEAIMA